MASTRATLPPMTVRLRCSGPEHDIRRVLGALRLSVLDPPVVYCPVRLVLSSSV